LKEQWSLKWFIEHGGERELKLGVHKGPIVNAPALSAFQKEPVLCGHLVWTPGNKSSRFLNTSHRILVLRCKLYKSWYSDFEDLTFDSFPQTLKQFQDWWNAFGVPRTVDVPTRMSGLEPAGNNEGTFSVPLSFEDKSLPQVDVGFRFVRQGDDFFYSTTIEDPNANSIDFQVHALDVVQYMVGQRTFSVNFRNLRPGVFERSFSDLAAAARNQMDLPLERVETSIHDDVSKGNDFFEAFGMKFPAGKVTLWGELLLLSVQLYFFVYLRQLYGKLCADDTGWDVPWVGMDSSSLSQIILLVSLVFLPIAAMGLLGGQAFLVWGKTGLPDGWWHRLLYRSEPFALGVALIASTGLGILSWRYRPRVEAEEPSCPSPLFF
jgi:hypothetical protein